MTSFSHWEKTKAWSVHAFTAFGSVAALFAVVWISEHQFNLAWAALFLALIIDGVDGTFARKFNVKRVLPFMDGMKIDYAVDILTYAFVPAWFLWEGFILQAGDVESMLPEGPLKWIAISIMLMVSMMYYGREGMVSEDHYFIGFPVLWNVVVFYMYYVVQAPAMINFWLVIAFSIMHFLPLKFPYPSQANRFLKMYIAAVAIAFAINIALVVISFMGSDSMALRWLSIACVLFFLLMTVYHTYFEKPRQK